LLLKKSKKFKVFSAKEYGVIFFFKKMMMIKRRKKISSTLHSKRVAK